jgi:hypothetical protein
MPEHVGCGLWIRYPLTTGPAKGMFWSWCSDLHCQRNYAHEDCSNNHDALSILLA